MEYLGMHPLWNILSQGFWSSDRPDPQAFQVWPSKIRSSVPNITTKLSSVILLVFILEERVQIPTYLDLSSAALRRAKCIVWWAWS